jgi:ABC-2 type transport system ATP-binding protein
VPTAVRVDDVSKRFRIYRERVTSLKERVIHFGRIPFEEFWALDDITLDIEQGETFGFLGHNGSGKSTLLKCMAGILQPTYGRIEVVGRLAALLELGAGFHPDLTGRENVFLNASILGMSRREIVRRFDDIVGFAELERFIDNQVKHYSSGMYVRLGFAVAVNMEPDVLLVDEVLSVGDEAFQRKCLDRVNQFQRDGRTIVVVSHAADLLRQICDRAAVLDHGKLVALGAPGEAVRSFREHLMQTDRHAEAEQLAVEPAPEEAAAEPAPVSVKGRRVRITAIDVDYAERASRPYLLPGEALTLRVAYTANEPLDDVVFGMAIYDMEGRTVFGANSDVAGVGVTLAKGDGEVCFEFESMPLLDGTYPLVFTIHTHDQAEMYDFSDHEHRFEVMNPTKETGLVHMAMRVRAPAAAKAEGAA